jgi:hypothetical protein
MPMVSKVDFLAVAAAIPLLLEGIGSSKIHLFFSGSYISFAFTLTVGEMPATLPAITYNFPLTTAEAAWCRAVGMDAFVVHLSYTTSYASFVARMPNEEEEEELCPPTAYNVPVTKFAVNAPLGVGIGLPSCH